MAGIGGVRYEVNRILTEQKDPKLQTEGWIHLYGVAQAATLLAFRRGLDPGLCAAAALMHDIHTFLTGEEHDHAQQGAAEAEVILHIAGGFSEGDIRVIVCMIQRHSDKAASDGPYEECLKDADVFAHWLYDPMKKFDKAKRERLERVFSEIGITAHAVEE